MKNRLYNNEVTGTTERTFEVVRAERYESATNFIASLRELGLKDEDEARLKAAFTTHEELCIELGELLAERKSNSCW